MEQSEQPQQTSPSKLKRRKKSRAYWSLVATIPILSLFVFGRTLHQLVDNYGSLDNHEHETADPYPGRRNGLLIRKRGSSVFAIQLRDVQTGQQRKSLVAVMRDKPRIVRLAEGRRFKRRPEKMIAQPMSNISRFNEVASTDSFLYLREFEAPFYKCTPMADWQTLHHPTCNLLHEIDNVDEPELLSTRGSWRTAWKVADNAGSNNETMVLKLLHMDRDFDQESIGYHQVDAQVLERLTSSKYVVDQYAFCGVSQLGEWATSDARSLIKNKRLRGRERLEIALGLARGLNDIHSLDYPNGSNATFAYNDVNIGNIMNVKDGLIKYNDFNIGIMMRWNKTKPCGMPVRFESALWRSPEELINQTYVSEKIDIYSLGNVLFQLLTKHQPWTHLEPVEMVGSRPNLTYVRGRKLEGGLPFFPEKIVKSGDIALTALYFGTRACYEYDPIQRPSAHQLAQGFEQVIQWMDNNVPMTGSMFHELFIVRDDKKAKKKTKTKKKKKKKREKGKK